MNRKKTAYNFDKNGEIIEYNANYDLERFVFHVKKEDNPKSWFSRIIMLLNRIVNERPYCIDWKDILNGYMERGIGDVPHYAQQYVFAYFLIENRADEKENMQEMYVKIVNALNKEIEEGELPETIEDREKLFERKSIQ